MKAITNNISRILSSIEFKFTVPESISDCCAILSSKNAIRIIGSSYLVKVETEQDGQSEFSIVRPRRTIDIAAKGYFKAETEDSTEIVGVISSNYSFLLLVLFIAGLVATYEIATGRTSGLCFGIGGVLIMFIGTTVELFAQYHAKLDMFNFVKHAYHK